jgi:hypothetical protein
MASRVRDTKPREVFCVQCGAFSGSRCITHKGKIVHGSHSARREYAAQHVTTVHDDGTNVVRRVSQPIGATHVDAPIPYRLAVRS